MPFKNYVTEIPLGQSGLSGSRNLTSLNPDELAVATNVTYETDIIGKEGGAAKYNSTAIVGGDSVFGGFDWHPTTAIQRMIAHTSNGRILKDSGDGTFSTILASGLSSSFSVVFVEGGQEVLANSKKLFIMNGIDAVQVLSGDGATTTSLATPPADFASSPAVCGCIHEERLWLATGHRVYYSMVSDHENFTGTGAGQLVVYPGVGTKILQLISFKGVLLVFKEDKGIFLIDTSSFDFSGTTIPKIMSLNQNLGIKSPQAATQIDDDIIFMDATGSVQLLSGIDNFNITGSNLSQRNHINTFVRDNVNLAYLNHVRTVFYAAKREVHFALPKSIDTGNSARLVLDLNHADNPRWRWSPRDVCESLFLRTDTSNIQRLVATDYEGFIWLLDQSVRSKDGVGYLAEFETPLLSFSWLDPNIASRQKLGCEIELVAEPREGSSIFIDVFWDSIFRHTITVPLTPIGTIFDEFVLDEDVLGGGGTVSRRRHKVLGSGRNLSLRFYNSAAAADFAISHVYFRFKVGNERLGRA